MSSSPSLTTDLRRGFHGGWVASYVVAGLLLVGLYSASPNFSLGPGTDQGLLAGDYLQEWVGGYIVRSDQRSRLYDQAFADRCEHDPSLVGFSWDPGEYLPMVYPPFWYLAVSPLSALPYHVAAGVWAALMTATIVVSCLVLRWWIRCEAKSAAMAVCVALLPASIVFPPVIENLTSGQKGGLCLLLFTVTYCLLDKKRSFAAGCVFGLLLFKPQFTLVLFPCMVLRRDLRFAAGFCVTAIALSGIALAMGWSLCEEYGRFLSHASEYLASAGYALEKSHSLYGAIALAGGGIGSAVRMTAAIAVLAVLICMGWTAWKWPAASWWFTSKAHRRMVSQRRSGERPLAVDLAAITLATLLVSPHLYSYDLTILLLPCASLLREDVRDWLGAQYRLTGWIAACLLAICGVSPIIAAKSGVQLTTVLMVALWWCFAFARTSLHFRVETAPGDRWTSPVDA